MEDRSEYESRTGVSLVSGGEGAKGRELSTMTGSEWELKVLVAPEPYWDWGWRMLEVGREEGGEE